jgi:hypothetical protein
VAIRAAGPRPTTERAVESLRAEPYSEGSPQSIWLWSPGSRGSPPRVGRGDLTLLLLLQMFLFPCGAGAAKSSCFQTYYLNLKLVRRRDFMLQPLKRGSREFDDLPAREAGKMKMILFCPDLVIVLLAVEVHQIELVDHAQFLQQLDGPIDGRAVDFWFSLRGLLQQAFRIEMRGRLLNRLDQSAALRSEAYSSGSQLIQQFMTRKQRQHL